MFGYGDVKIRLRGGRVVDGKLLTFQTIPIWDSEHQQHKVLVYGVCETNDGDFLARQLSEIKRGLDDKIT